MENPYGTRLSIDDQGRLSWPVLFLYPEYAQSDFISAFHEDSRYLLARNSVLLLACSCPVVCRREITLKAFWLREENSIESFSLVWHNLNPIADFSLC